jgi:hypothetical protein
MRRKAIAWALFLASVLLLSFAATPYSHTADALIITLRLTLLIVLSILIARERWRSRPDAAGKSTHAPQTALT